MIGGKVTSFAMLMAEQPWVGAAVMRQLMGAPRPAEGVPATTTASACAPVTTRSPTRSPRPGIAAASPR
jgi:hypothetical protein